VQKGSKQRLSTYPVAPNSAVETVATKICVITGSRAEYGLLYWLLHDLRSAPEFQLQLVVTGMHLAREFGHTVDQIVQDGFAVDIKVEMLVSSDTPGGVCKSMALAMAGLSDALHRLQPDAVVVLGDRFEMLVASTACLIHNVPLVHIAGGDTTEGANDESMRHAITKLAHVHLVTNELSAQRVVQMGEDPSRVHVVGSPGLDHLRRRKLLDRKALEEALGAPLWQRNLLVTFHPATLQPGLEVVQLQELLAALDAQSAQTRLWVTLPNADSGGRAISHALESWAAEQGPRVQLHASLGSLLYLSLMAQADVVVGNSSSGLYEAPSLRVPTVNIGDRQQGRLCAASVLHCVPQRDEIVRCLQQAERLDCHDVINPYGDGYSVPRIIHALQTLPPRASLLRKPFHLLEVQRVH
jgi:UDP-hydrolysing UDP-N-acetyl-D-glucosamine 2-epimerase